MISNMIRGRVIRLPFDDVSTDVIAPTHYRATTGEDRELKTLRPHVMEFIRPGLDSIVKPGDVFVVGRNYGLGSHRETAVRIFKVWGVQAVVAETAARLWFRNAIAAGLPVFHLKDATKLFEEGDQIEIDLQNWCIGNATKKDMVHAISPFPDTVMRVLRAGGMMPLLKQCVDSELSKRALKFSS